MELSGLGDMGLFWRGLLFGLAIAAPVGPIGVLCIRRTLAQGYLTGLLSGVGAATADAIYGTIAGFGLTVLSTVLVDHAVWIRLIGGAFLCYLGVKTFMARPAEEAAEASARGLVMAYVSTVFLTLTNPATIISFAAIFAGLGLASAAHTSTAAGLLVLGVFCGSALWWTILSSGVSLLRQRVNLRGMRWLNRISGLILVGFGIAALSMSR